MAISGQFILSKISHMNVLLQLIIVPPICVQEHYDQKWLMDLGCGIEQEEPKYVNEWLFDWLNSGRLAEAAWEGYQEALKNREM